MRNDYSKYPDHPLYGVPEEALKAAHEALEAAMLDRSTDSLSMVEPIADAVVAAFLRKMHEYAAFAWWRLSDHTNLSSEELQRSIAEMRRGEWVDIPPATQEDPDHDQP